MARPVDQQAAVAAQAEETPFNSPRLTKYHVPFIEAHTAELRELPLDLQQRVAEVVRDLHIFNNNEDQIELELARTFGSSITGPNRAIVPNNLENTYGDALSRCERLVREMRELLTHCDL